MKTIILAIGLLALGGCTEQIRAKTFGGTAVEWGRYLASWHDGEFDRWLEAC